MAKLGPRVTEATRIDCPQLEGTGINIHCTVKGDDIWIQIRQPGREKDAAWRIVAASFITKDGEIHFKCCQSAT
jgi:hypothetical protein